MSDVVKLTAEQAAAAMPRRVYLPALLEALRVLGVAPDVAGAVTEATLRPDRLEVTIALIGQAGIPTVTFSVPVER